MTDLNALVIFAKIVEANSFSEAARRLHMPVSTVSRRIAELEEHMGVRLLDRTTRSLRLTDIGAEVFEQAQRSAELSAAVDAIVFNKLSEVAGVIRIAAPPSISDTLLIPLVNAFQAAHPQVKFEITITDRSVDPLGGDIDLVLRGGVLQDSTLVARKLLTYRHQLVASPAYLAKNAPLETPPQLLEHRLLAFARRQPINRWSFRHVNGRDRETVAFQPFMTLNDYAGSTPALLAGAGIGILPPIVQPELMRSGRLVEVLPDWRFRTIDLQLIQVGGRHAPRTLRVFKDFAAKMAPTLFGLLPT